MPPAARVGLRCSPSLHASPFSLSVSVQRFHRALGVRLRPRSGALPPQGGAGARAECSVPPFHPRPRGHSSRVPLRPRRPVRCGRHSRGRREARFSSSFRCRHCRDESDDGLQAVYLLEQTLQVPLRFRLDARPCTVGPRTTWAWGADPSAVENSHVTCDSSQVSVVPWYLWGLVPGPLQTPDPRAPQSLIQSGLGRAHAGPSRPQLAAPGHRGRPC